MKILILSWRDIKNPASGGAEVLTHEIGLRWVRQGHDVTLFSSSFKNSRSNEIIDGVKIVREGRPSVLNLGISVHVRAYFWYLKNKTEKFDVVIDEIHGLPFFTPLFVKEKKVVLICEVANEIWDAVFPFPFNVIGKTIENFYIHFYKNVPFLTISHSTEKDLIKKGIKKESITVLPMGANIPKNLIKTEKEKIPTILYVGRISKTKGVEDAILALSMCEFPKNLRLWIVGRGEEKYVSKLHELARKLKVNMRIEFLGYIEEREKFDLMARSHVLIVPSIKEGWGLIVTEAGACGTPSVVYDVPGLNEVVVNNESGLVVDRDPKNLSLGIQKIFNNKVLYKKLQDGAKRRAMLFTWNDTARVSLKILSQ